MKLQVKRAYDPASPDDGYRVLVDRVWPRGMRKEKLRLDAWEKEIAPSSELRRWFGHDPARWDEFRERYFDELADKERLLRELRTRARRAMVTLLFSARDAEHNNAVALAEFLRNGRKSGRSRTARKADRPERAARA